ncbi:MAG: protease modulator HflC, partial [Bryobacterales bacterium]|nr:protease modulator HflC [Bryobacterales bacterium]
GEEQARRMRAEADRQREEIRAKAYKEAEMTKGEGDAAAARVYGAAYSRNQSLFKLTRTLEAYRKALDEDTTVILSADSELLRLLTKGQ